MLTNWTFLYVAILLLCPKLKKLGGQYSNSLRCWYFDYTATAAYKMLRDNFADLVIENPKTVPTQSLAGLP
jgi:hypothetical protein